MKQLICILSLGLALLFTACTHRPANTEQAVNPLIGNGSFVSTFGYDPDDETDENLRVKTHLAYVENLLRNNGGSGLSPALRARRLHLLDLLHDYQVAEVFPKNHDYADRRKPCFIDREGRICAVGYLVEQTAGRGEAERINAKYKYDELLAMNDKRLDDWVAGNGLTKEEAAMIQPTYGYTPANNNHIKTEYGISSAVLSGANLSMAAINGVSMVNKSGSWVIPIIGLATGAGQVFLGAINFPREEEQTGWYGGTTTNESQKVVSMVNIGIGTTTVILSTWNLLTHRNPKDTRTSWNVYSFPTTGNNSGLAFSMTRRF